MPGLIVSEPFVRLIETGDPVRLGTARPASGSAIAVIPVVSLGPTLAEPDTDTVPATSTPFEAPILDEPVTVTAGFAGESTTTWPGMLMLELPER